jgi:hypothetical protein
MKDLEKKLLEICGNDEKVFEKVKIEVFNLLENPEMFENEEIGFNYSTEYIDPRTRKDLEILEIDMYLLVSKFLKEIGYKPIRIESSEYYCTQYFKK